MKASLSLDPKTRLNSRVLHFWAMTAATLGYVCSLAALLAAAKPASMAANKSEGRLGKTVDYVRDIQPILKTSCYQCHGAEMQMGKLRLDSKPLAFQGGLSGKAIVPGKSAESLLVQRILGLGGIVRMPLQGNPLTEDQIAVIRTWIDQGAIWPEKASVGDANIGKHW